MEQTQDFSDILFQAVMERQHYFDSYVLPKLQDEFRICQSAAKTVRTVLVKKGVLYDDPYTYDSRMTEIEIPQDDSFTETEKAGVIGQRLSRYEAMIDFLNNYYQFSCDYLNTDRISKLVALNYSFHWESFSINSGKPNTKGLADLVSNIRGGNDPLSISIVNDSLSQLSKASLAITKYLKELTEFHKERYKLSVRKMALAGLSFSQDAVATGSAMKEIKRAFVTNMKGQPFYTELIEEVLKEDYSPDHAVLQQELLTRLSTTKKNDQKTATEASLKPFLMDGLRTLGSATPQLEEIINKLQENQNQLINREKGFFQKLAQLFRKAFNLPEEVQDITFTSVDPVTQTGKRETIIFPDFIDDLKRKSRVYTGFTAKGSVPYQKIEALDEPQILDLLTRNIAELNVVLKQCNGIDEYFKQSAQPEIRDRIRGIKVEISAIRNNLVKANQSRAEYASQVEELQQLKKLGITNV